MSSIRRYVKRAEPPREVSFDQQFWPIVIAMMVMGGFTVGTIVTVADKDWMWPLLLVLPITIATLILVLWSLPSRWVRRSLQLALVLSIAINLFFIIMANRVDLFRGIAYDIERQPLNRKKEKTIAVSVMMRERPWEQLNETQDQVNDQSPDVKRVADRAASKWSSQPVKSNNSENQQPQLVRRKMNQTSQPKLGESPSKLSRSERQVKAQSSENPSATAASAPDRTSSPKEQQTNDSVQVTRQSQRSEIENSKSEQAVVQKATPSPERKQTENADQATPAATAENVRRTRRAESAETVARNSATAADSSQASSQLEAKTVEMQRSSSSANVESPTTEQAKVAQSSATRRESNATSESQNTSQVKRSSVAAQSQSPSRTSSSSSAAKTTPNESQLVAKSATVSKQQSSTQATITQPSSEQQQSSSSIQVARNTQRRSPSQTQSLPNPRSNEAPRRARTTANNESSPRTTESPSRTTQQTVNSEQGSAEAQSLALTRSTSGVTGSQSSANLAKANSSAQSPAKVASDSFERSRAQQNQSQLNLHSSQASTTPRSFAGQTEAASVLKARSSSNSSLPGQTTPQEVSANASASIADTTSRQNSDTVAAEVGSSTADIGPTKVVMETRVDRAAGGGQPEIENTGNPQPIEKSGKTSPAASVATTNPSNRATAEFQPGHDAPSSQATDANAASSVVKQSSNDSPVTSGPTESGEERQAEVAQPSSTLEDAVDGLARADNEDDEDEDEEDELAAQLARLNTRSGQTQSAPSSTNRASTVAANEGESGETGSAQASDTNVARSTNANSELSGQMSSEQADTAVADSTSSADRSDARSAAPSVDSSQAGSISRRRGAVASNAQSPDSGTSSSSVADSQGTNSPSSGLESRALNAAKVAARSIPGSTLGNVAKSAMGVAASALPLVQSSDRKQSNDPANDGDGGSQPSNLGRTGAGSPSRIASTSPNSSTNQNSGVAENATGSADAGEAANSSASVDVAKQRNEGMALDIAAEDGPAGLGQTLARNPGVLQRNASKRQQSLESLVESRFRKTQPGGTKALSPARIKANMAFRSRRPESIQNAAPRTTEYINNGLEFLARYQRADGSWSLGQFDPGWKQNRVSADQIVTRFDSDTAATGLAILAFQGAGYNHREYKYAQKLDSAIQFLIENQQDSGLLYISTQKESDKYCQLYSHGIATIALTEAYGMTQDPALKEPVEKAIQFIIDSQHKQLGGWRYQPGNMSDTSVSGWMVMALHSARLAGIEFDQDVWVGVESWLNQARDPQLAYKFRYRPGATDGDGQDRAHQREVSQSMTAVAMLMRLYTGWNREQIEVQLGAEYLLTRLPSDKNSLYRDTYYWYYATQVLAHVGGEQWDEWNTELEKLLVDSQVKGGPMAGSWDPYKPVPDRWGYHAGRIYVTTMNILSLEVRHRLLPIYDDILNENGSFGGGIDE